MVSFYLVNSQPERTFPGPVQVINFSAGPTTSRANYLEPPLETTFLKYVWKSVYFCQILAPFISSFFLFWPTRPPALARPQTDYAGPVPRPSRPRPGPGPEKYIVRIVLFFIVVLYILYHFAIIDPWIHFDINEYKEQGADIFINKVLRSPSASIDSNNSNSLNNTLSRRYSQQVRSSSASIDHKMNNSDRKKQRDENEKNLINNNNNKQTTDVNNNNKRDNSSSRRNGNNYQKQQAISNFLDSYRFRNNSTSMNRGDREEEEEEEEEEFVINEDVLKEIDDDDNNNSDDDETSLNQSANSYFVELDGNKYVIDDSDVADAMLDDGYGDLYDENGKINYDINAGKSNIVDTIKEVGLFFNKSINDERNPITVTCTGICFEFPFYIRH